LALERCTVELEKILVQLANGRRPTPIKSKS
jgi:hypothetical protein